MTYLTRNLRQAVTYWAYSGIDGWGAVTYAAPVAITGRWEDKQVLFRDAEGQEVLSNAIVYVSQAVIIKGYLYLGTSVAVNPLDVSGAKEIRNYDITPNLKATAYLRKAWL